jgi:hypothetical protein
MVPDDFIKVGWFKRTCAMFTKLLPPLNILLHWGIMILIIILWILVGTKHCPISAPTLGGFLHNVLMYADSSFVLAIVNSAFWIFLHYGGAIYRDLIYVEPFMYEPQIGKGGFCKAFFIRKLGP